MSGAGTLALNASNSFTGGTLLSNGMIVLGNSASLGSQSITFAANATLQSGAASLTLSNTISIATNVTGTVDSGGQTLTLAARVQGNGTLGISDSIGGGAVVVTATNAYTGGTLINSNATLIGSTSYIPGAITNNGTLQFNQTNDATYTNAITGSGRFIFKTSPQSTTNADGSTTVTATNKLILAAANTYTSGTVVNGGELIVTNAAIDFTRNIVLTNYGGVHFTATNNETFSGNISGNGTLTVNVSTNPVGSLGASNNMVLTLSGTNTYTGLTTISDTVSTRTNDNLSVTTNSFTYLAVTAPAALSSNSSLNLYGTNRLSLLSAGQYAMASILGNSYVSLRLIMVVIHIIIIIIIFIIIIIIIITARDLVWTNTYLFETCDFFQQGIKSGSICR
jgi:autotransporter-associated beta strand protein